jgi:hypothetical protein
MQHAIGHITKISYSHILIGCKQPPTRRIQTIEEPLGIPFTCDTGRNQRKQNGHNE